jgi:hypothetical protein
MVLSLSRARFKNARSFFFDLHATTVGGDEQTDSRFRAPEMAESRAGT